MRILLLAIVFLPNNTTLFAKGFDLNSLPRGASVTLPQPAVTIIPLNTRVTLSATDSPQSLKITTHSQTRRGAVTLELAVYDRHSERVRYLTIRPGVPYVYSFKGLSSIVLIPKVAGGGQQRQVLRIESDKSLTIAK